MGLGHNAQAGPSRLYRPVKPLKPFVSAENRPGDDEPDGIFRVVIISSGSVASIKIPDIISSLSKDPNISIQVVTTGASSHFYSQEDVDGAIRRALIPARPVNGDDSMDGEGPGGGQEYLEVENFGVKIWRDEDEWSDWKKVGDPILHIELRRWADLVVVAPCSADMLAKIAGGLCDNLATSLLRALSPDTPKILFPAMNTHMYQHPLTAEQLFIVQEKLEYMVSGPQGVGKLACGDEGPGKMTDWRDIVTMIQDFAVTFRNRLAASLSDPSRPLRAEHTHAQVLREFNAILRGPGEDGGAMGVRDTPKQWVMGSNYRPASAFVTMTNKHVADVNDISKLSSEQKGRVWKQSANVCTPIEQYHGPAPKPDQSHPAESKFVARLPLVPGMTWSGQWGEGKGKGVSQPDGTSHVENKGSETTGSVSPPGTSGSKTILEVQNQRDQDAMSRLQQMQSEEEGFKDTQYRVRDMYRKAEQDMPGWPTPKILH